MILCSLHIKHWRKLTSVALSGFSQRITVIYAPNKTGKSSLVGAIRCALVEYDYDTTRIDPVVPWGTNQVPEVTLEFEVKAQRYRLRKRFTKRKEGGAELYELTNSGISKLIKSDKEVTPAVRQILGIEKSTTGIAQLLWVEQGTVDLPKVDEDLDQCLRPVLGNLITGRDGEFRQILWRKMQEWFTSEANAKAGKHKATSSLKRTEQQIEEWQRKVGEIEQKFEQIEHLLSEVNQKQQEIATAEADVRTTRAEVQTLSHRDRALAEKREKARQSESILDEKQRELNDLEQAVQTHQKYEQAVQKAHQQLQQKQEEEAPLRHALDSAKQALRIASEEKEKAEQAMQELDGRRAELEAMRRLLEIQERDAETKSVLGKARQKEKQIESTQENINKLLVPEKRELERTKRLLDRLGELDAEFKAAQLTLTINAARTGSVVLEIDRQNKKKVSLKAGQAIERSARQRIQLDIENFGSIEVARGKEEAKIEEQAAQRDAVGRELSDLLAPWGVAALDASEVIAELTRRATEHKEWKRTIEEYQNELTELAPDGIPVLEAASEKGKIERGNLIQFHRKFESWEPSRKSLEEAEEKFQDTEKKRKEALRIAKEKEKSAKTSFEKAEEEARRVEGEVSNLKIELAGKKGAYQAHEQEWGTLEDVSKRVETKKREVAEAQSEFDKHRLTEEEERVPEQLEEAKRALVTRETRLQNLREQLATLTGQLRSCEGLHAERAAAEQALEFAKQEHKRIEVEVEAYRMLLRFFDEIRDESVEKSVAPVKELVDPWLRELDGASHPKVSFDPNLRVSGLTVQNGDTLAVDEATSYGEREQLGTLVRLAYGAVLAKDDPQVVILDDPLAHADTFRHRKMLQIIEEAAKKNLQIIVLTCHPNRFDHLKDAQMFDLKAHLESVPTSG